MSSNESSFIHEFMKEFMDVLEKLAKLYTDAQRARALDAIKEENLLPWVAMLAKSPVWDTLKELAKDAAAKMLEEEAFSPLGAVKPARQLLQALDTVYNAGVELKRWKDDVRFNPPKLNRSTAPPRICLFNRKPPQQLVKVPAAEIIDQLVYLTGLLTIAGQEARLASQAIMRVRDPLLHIASEHTLPELPQIEQAEFSIPLPTSWYQSKGDKGRDLLDYLEAFGDHLVRTSERGRQRIRNASVDDKAFSPGVVGAESIAIINVARNGLSTCNSLIILAMQYMGDSVAVE